MSENHEEMITESDIRELDLSSTLESMTTSSDDYHFNSTLLDIRYNYLLRPYTDRPTVFRRLLTKTESVISGGTVVKFIKGDWPTGDLDVYTPNHASADRIRSFFESSGFTLVVRPAPRRPYPRISPGFITVISLTRHGRKVDIITSEKHSALYPISRFWNTFLFNFLTGDSLCIAYPELTLVGHGFIRGIGMAHPRLEMLIEKYSLRGYTSHKPDSLDLGLVLPKTRRFGDEECLVMAIGPVLNPRDGAARRKLAALSNFVWV
ncbi:hypothetical protein NLI96_g6811 [Meripilus lineatus]|uniref:Uncharacterized protein n=1 Tax=Meripilus lineatus TaxID=2056292 RepID=A0AAD5YHS3_9APHY|nr:hypothetical protein NLI96_g6811 [Physisporinus lineatus]